jgi:acetylornithine deacetylase/succinyl-diaminopimelate desuccinylase-like protein
MPSQTPVSARCIRPSLTLAVIIGVWLQSGSPLGLAQTISPADKAEARDIFAKAIAMNTALGQGNVPALAQALAQRFTEAGFPSQDVHVLPFKDTANLVVRYRGTGQGGKPIALMAHMDVVAANRSDWQRNPFELIEENGYFFGRGTSDVKQEVALLSETFLRLKRAHFTPSRDLILVFSGDEETAQDSIDDLVAHHRELVDAEFALNGDGGGGQLDDSTGAASVFYIQGAEKTSAGFKLTTENPGGHSSQPRKDNAIYTIAKALNAIQAYRFPIKSNEWTVGEFKTSAALTPGKLGQAMAQFAAHPTDAKAAAVIAEYPHTIGKVRTTCVATLMQGGHAENALPQHAEATINCRIFPGTPASEVAATLQKLAGPDVKVSMVYKPLESAPSPLRADVVQAVTDAVHLNYPAATIIPTQAAYATDGAVFRGYQIPTYGVGSTFIKPSDEFAHGLNERIPVSTFYNGLSYWDRLIKNLAGGKP